MLSSGEVEHDQFSLARRTTKAAPELLEKHCGTLGWAEEEQRVDVRNVDAFVVDVDHAQHLHAAGIEVATSASSFDAVRPAGHDLGRKSTVFETAGDFFGMADVHAERDGAHVGPPPDAFANCPDCPQHERLGRPHEPACELIGRVATRGPCQVAEVGAFHVEHVVAKWHERVRNGVPDAEVADPRPWKVTLIVETVGALRGAGQAEQLFRCHSVEQFLPGISRGVVSLVQNHMVERGGIDGRAVAERVDRRKDMALHGGPLAVIQQLAEVTHLEHVAKDATRLLEYLAAVRDVQ